jgi:hypothetical protein
VIRARLAWAAAKRDSCIEAAARLALMEREAELYGPAVYAS